MPTSQEVGVDLKTPIGYSFRGYSFIAQSERNGVRNRRISNIEVIELVTHTHRGVATHRKPFPNPDRGQSIEIGCVRDAIVARERLFGKHYVSGLSRELPIPIEG